MIRAAILALLVAGCANSPMIFPNPACVIFCKAETTKESK